MEASCLPPSLPSLWAPKPRPELETPEAGWPRGSKGAWLGCGPWSQTDLAVHWPVSCGFGQFPNGPRDPAFSFLKGDSMHTQLSAVSAVRTQECPGCYWESRGSRWGALSVGLRQHARDIGTASPVCGLGAGLWLQHWSPVRGGVEP